MLPIFPFRLRCYSVRLGGVFASSLITQTKWACSFNSFISMGTVPYDGDVEVVLTEGFPASMEELSAPQISFAPGVQVGLIRSVQLLAVVLGVWLDLQGVLSHQQTKRHGGWRGNPVDEFGFHFAFFVFKKRSVTLERIWESPWTTGLMCSVTLCDAGAIISSFLYQICFSLGKVANDNVFFRLFLAFFIFRNATCRWSFAAKSERRGASRTHRCLATNE